MINCRTWSIATIVKKPVKSVAASFQSYIVIIKWHHFTKWININIHNITPSTNTKNLSDKILDFKLYIIRTRKLIKRLKFFIVSVFLEISKSFKSFPRLKIVVILLMSVKYWQKYWFVFIFILKVFKCFIMRLSGGRNIFHIYFKRKNVRTIW